MDPLLLVTDLLLVCCWSVADLSLVVANLLPTYCRPIADLRPGDSVFV